MIHIIKNIIAFLTDPKNTRMLLFALIVIFALLFLRQCGLTNEANERTLQAKNETIRVSNNFEASMDTIKKYKIDKNTWRSEKQVYELSQNDLIEKYKDLLGKFEYEQNKPPTTIIKTEYVIKEIITNVAVNGTIDSIGNVNLTVLDSLSYDSLNYRKIAGSIPAKVKYDSLGYSINTSSNATFSINQGMSLNFGLFKDKETKKILLKVDTDYPGITFTKLNGADILDNPKNKKILRNTRKNWSIGINTGYGIFYNSSDLNIRSGPYIGFGLTYSPKLLQW